MSVRERLLIAGWLTTAVIATLVFVAYWPVGSDEPSPESETTGIQQPEPVDGLFSGLIPNTGTEKSRVLDTAINALAGSQSAIEITPPSEIVPIPEPELIFVYPDGSPVLDSGPLSDAITTPRYRDDDDDDRYERHHDDDDGDRYERDDDDDDDDDHDDDDD